MIIIYRKVGIFRLLNKGTIERNNYLRKFSLSAKVYSHEKQKLGSQVDQQKFLPVRVSDLKVSKVKINDLSTFFKADYIIFKF